MSWKIWSLKKSPWVFHVNTGACNNCDIEIVDLLTPKFDVERFGVKLVGSPRHADALLVTGGVTAQAAASAAGGLSPDLKAVRCSLHKRCACDKGIFTTGYHMVGPVDKIIKEIDPNAIIAYVPGCPPKPEAMISGIVKALSAL